MAKYTITHSCGHQVVHNIVGRNRDWEVKRLQERPCTDCYREGMAAVAGEAAERAGLPTLIGSEKQVQWALSIRETMLKGLDEYLAYFDGKYEEARAKGTDLSRADAMRAKLVAAIETVRGETKARWWIDNRDRHAESILRDLVTA